MVNILLANLMKTRVRRILDAMFLYGPFVVLSICFLIVLREMVMNVLDGNEDLFLIDVLWLCFISFMMLRFKRRSRAFYAFFGLIMMGFMLEAFRFLWTGESAKLGLGWFHVLVICSGVVYIYLFMTRRRLLN